MEDEEKNIRVLSTRVIALSKIFLPDMLIRKSGKIMIVSSVAHLHHHQLFRSYMDQLKLL